MKIELPKLEQIKSSKEEITLEDMDKIEELHKDGYRFDELDIAYGRKKGTIARIYRKWRNGEDITVRQYILTFDYGKLNALINAGWNEKMLMQEFHIDDKELKKRIKEMKKVYKNKQ